MDDARISVLRTECLISDQFADNELGPIALTVILVCGLTAEVVSDIAIFVLKRDVKLQLTN